MSTQHTLQITLRDSLKEFVEGQLAAGAYSSGNDYILALLREAQKKAGLGKGRAPGAGWAPFRGTG